MMQRKTRLTVEEFKNARKKAKQICRAKKRSSEEEMLYDLEEKYGKNECRKFFEGIRQIKAGFIPRTKLCKNEEGNIIADEEQIMKLWYDHFKNLLNKSGCREKENVVYFGPDLIISAPTAKEVHEVIKNLKNNRAPGSDGINAELIKKRW